MIVPGRTDVRGGLFYVLDGYLVFYSIDSSVLEHGDLMSVEIVMPQMGESITEGTVSKWLKQVGERVEKDEAILEISTDKVDAEVPSPGAGILLEIRTQEGETVEVGTVVAIVGDSSAEAAVPSPVSEVQYSRIPWFGRRRLVI